jgi:mitotic-spindle organizing protein 1
MPQLPTSFCVAVPSVASVTEANLPSPAFRLATVAHEISRLLDTGLDKETLSILIALVETGVNPEALAHVVKELRRESAELKAALAAVAAQPQMLATQASEGEPSEAQL